MTRRVAQVSGVAAALLGATVAFSAPASAADDSIYWASNYNSTWALVGDAKFYSYGEGVKLWDDEADGHGVIAQVDVKNSNGTYSRWKTVYNGNGNGTSVWDDSGDIAEGRGMRIRTCSVDGRYDTTPSNCGDWVYGSA